MIAARILHLISRSTPPHRQRGLTLVEGVLAILLLATMVVGIAALYAGSEKTARGGQLHSTAEKLARDIKTRIGKADPRSNFETRIGATCNDKTAKKDPAEYEVACWQEKVATELTNGSSHISLDTTTDPIEYIIVVSWSEPRTGTASYVVRVPRPVAGTASSASVTEPTNQ